VSSKVLLVQKSWTEATNASLGEQAEPASSKNTTKLNLGFPKNDHMPG